MRSPARTKVQCAASYDAVLLEVAEEHVDNAGVQHITMPVASLNDFAEHLGALQREAIADWLERQPTMSMAEAAMRLRNVRAEH